jgi:BirA family biotin operon repressor/biotin-[acetyl-CoA-carboxylase] ligase
VKLGDFARGQGFRLLDLEDVDSTNDEARRLIAGGEHGPLWIVAAAQTKGRGRLGREWISPPGNLFASLILHDIGDVSTAPQLGFVTGVAAMRALKALRVSAGAALKWPNDLLLDAAKLGGVLLETVTVPTGDLRAPTAPVAIIGIGVNCATAPDDLPYPARALSMLGPDAPTRETFFSALSDAFVETLAVWRKGDGFAQLRAEWLRHAAGLGETIRVALARETIEGRFETIDAAGRLVLTTAAGPRIIEAGDVLIGPRHTLTEALV